MIKNILGIDFKYEDDRMYRKLKTKWNCCNDLIPRPKGYIQIKINKKQYLLHRLIYKYHNEDWDITDISKKNEIDHININPLDNRIENLRVVNHRQNMRNQKKKENCSSKYIGVHKNGKKWFARITIDGKKKHLGSYDTEKEASEVYEKEYDKIMTV
tara:strand:+ start:1031 stop:1501 length:471 start_codon:yes stop_codon:yes gene_type:complete